jgi:hypothetical protein
VSHADGQYYLVWRYDADGRPRTFGDGGVRYAPYDAANGSLGQVTTLEGATHPRVAGDRLAVFRPDATGSRNGTVAVRNLSTGARRTAAVTDFEDLAVGTETAAWVVGEGPEETVRYRRADGSVGTVDAPNASGIEDVRLVARRTAEGRRVDTLVFDAQAPARNGTAGEAAMYYRVRQGDAWGRSRPLTTGGTDLTFVDVAAAGRREGFLTVAAAENVSAPAEQRDLFAVGHRYGSDLAVSANVVDANVTPGESVALEWSLRNEGGRPARDVTVVFEDETGVIRRVPVDTLRPGATLVATPIRFEANRSRTVTVRVDNATGDPYAANDAVTRTLMRPNLRVASVDRAPAPGGVAYEATVRNDGPVAARNVTPGLTNNGRPVVNESVGDLPPNGSATVRLVAPTNRTNAGLVTRIRADPADRIDEADETTGTRRVSPPRPDLFVTDVGIAGRVTVPDDQVKLNVTVGNRGFAGANATIRGESLFPTRVTLNGTRANQTRFRTVDVVGRPLEATRASTTSGSEGERRVTVEVRPDTVDARPADNVASTTVPVIRTNPFDEPIAPGGRLPTDPTADGLYEDVDGNGVVDFRDVISLVFADFDRFEGNAAATAALDFDGDGDVDFVDVIELVFRIQ